MKRIWIVMLACVVLLSATTNVWAQALPEIKIVQPGDRRNMGLGESNVVVEITGVDPQAVTWQVLIDGEIVATVTDGGTTAAIDMKKPTGPRRIRAVLLNKENEQIASNEILVIAAPMQAQEPIFNREVMAQAMGVFVVVVLGLLIGAYVISRRIRHQPIHSIPGTNKQ